MANISERSSITIKLLGDPKKVLGMEGDKARNFLGTIYGTAEKVKTKVMTDKAGNSVTYEPISGVFEAVPAVPTDDGTQAYQSGTLYLPGGIHERLANALKKDDSVAIDFAIEVYTVKASNAAGYTYDLKTVIDSKASDPMAAMRALVAEKSKPVAALLAAPDKKAGGAKAA